MFIVRRYSAQNQFTNSINGCSLNYTVDDDQEGLNANRFDTYIDKSQIQFESGNVKSRTGFAFKVEN